MEEFHGSMTLSGNSILYRLEEECCGLIDRSHDNWASFGGDQDFGFARKIQSGTELACVFRRSLLEF